MEQLLAQLKQAGVQIQLHGGQLKLRKEDGKIPPDLLKEVKARKQALVEYLGRDLELVHTFKTLEGRDYYELSLSQQELWLSSQRYNGPIYNQVRPFLLEGELEPAALQKAIESLLDRYEILRTTFHLLDEQPCQRVNDRRELFGKQVLEIHRLEQEEATYEGAVDLLRTAGLKTFDLENGPLIEFLLIEYAPARHLFALLSHHIIMDGWSSQIVMKDIVEAYLAFAAGEDFVAAPLNFHFKDFAAQQNQKLVSDGLDQHRDFWTNYLQGELRPLPLPKDFTRPAVKSFHGANHFRLVEEELSTRIKAYCRDKNSTLFIFFQTLLKTLLYRYTQQKDLLIGSVFAGRESVELESQVGSFANILPLRSFLREDQSFAELLEEIKADTFRIYQHQFYPFTQILKDLDLSFDRSHSPLFDVMLIVQNFLDDSKMDDQLGAIKVKPLEYELTTNTLDLYYIISERANGQLGIDMGYNPDLFKEERIERMQGHLCQLMESVLEDDTQRVSTINFMSREERYELLHSFNATSIGPPPYESILEWFNEIVSTYPEHPALVWRNTSYTYRELDEATNRLAIYLSKEWQIQRGDFVGVLTGRNHHTILSMLALMKLGAIHMPIEEELPVERIQVMVNLVKAKALISLAPFAAKTEAINSCPTVLVDRSFDQIEPHRPKYQVKASDAAYIIFTSGSTGTPKPIVAKHEGLINNIYDYLPKLGLQATDNYLQFFATGFDGFFFDIFPLLGGATLVMADKPIINDREHFLQYLEEQQITMAATTPSYLDILERPALDTLHTLISAGEEVDAQNAIHYAKHKNFYNLYGPAEVTIIASLYKVDANKTYPGGIPIGKPCANKLVYILDYNLHLVPIGFPGEIAISGAGIVDGYLNDEQLGTEKFVPNPYAPGQMLYRTGDRGQWTEEGNLLFLGRKDNQVKINGYRVEIGEIEKTMLNHQEVSRAVIVVDGRAKNKELIGFYQKSKPGVSPLALRHFLGEKIPGYMVPNRLIEIEQWPVSHQGKVDKKKLLTLSDHQEEENLPVAPQNETQAVIQKIWESYLGRKNIGISDNFFEIGGDSLLAIRVNSAIRERLQQSLSVREIFSSPNIASLARLIESKTSSKALPALSPVSRAETIPLSFAQERLWFLDQLGGSLEYHMPTVLRLRNKLNREVLEKALAALVQRHEVLRTVIKTQDGRAHQVVMPAEQWAMEFGELPQAEGVEWQNRFVEERLSRPFDLSADYMLRASLLRLAKEDHLFVIVVHHIASDGWSQSLLIKDLMIFYRDFSEGKKPSLEPPTLQYADYAYWQRKHLTEDYLSKKIDWWESQLKGIEPLRLPTDRPRPSVQSHRGDRVNFKIDKQLTDQLKALALASEATLFMLLLSAIKIVLHRYSGQPSVCIGTSLANRNTAEEEAIVGFFINTLALRSHLGGNPRFIDLLQQVKSTTLLAFAHQDVPFERVVERVETKRSLSHSPIFQVEFVLQNLPEVPDMQLGDLDLSFESEGNKTSQFDLSIAAYENAEGLTAGINYCSDLFDRSRMERMAGHLRVLLQSIVSNPMEKVNQLALLTAAEKKQLFGDFNATQVEYPHEATLVELFEERVKKNPEAIAVEEQDKMLTYAQLDQKANQLAHYLSSKGVAKEDLVSVCLDRSIDMLISILGIMKCGAAYLPIDPEYPAHRLEYILEDSRARAIITNQQHRNALSLSEEQQVILLEEERNDIARHSRQPLDVSLTTTNLAYVIYTSGSTGRPKGVMIEHRGMVNHLFAKINELHMNSTSRMLQNASQSFDISIWQFLVALVKGGTTIVFPQQMITDPVRFLRGLVEKKLTHVEVVPSYLRMLLEEERHLQIEFPDLEYLLVTGETLPKPLTKAWFERFPHIPLVNAYGPTEASDDITHCHLSAEPEQAQVPIGHVLQNLAIYVLNEQMELCPLGVPGEIGVTGIGVGRGYLNRPELTAEKFVANPFVPGERIYLTGDLGFWYPNGQLGFMGRKDHQVKIRGHRIELGEIEAVLDQLPEVRQSIVQVKELANGHKRLVAYAVLIKTGQMQKEDILRNLKSQLPDYMMPSLLVELEAFPLTPNGKIDRKALPEPREPESTGEENKAPSNKTEQQLAEIWMDLLNRENIGIHDNFFELGGDSIITIQVASRAKRMGYFLQPKDLFLHQTIAALAQAIQQGESKNTLSEQGLLDGTAPLLPIQQTFFENEHPAMWHYNQSVLLRLHKDIQEGDVQQLASYLPRQHDALRFRYRKEKSLWQQNYQAADQALKVVNLTAVSSKELASEITRACEINQAALRPSDDSTYHLLLIQTPDTDPYNRLFLVIHHLAVDGISWRILLDDLENACKQLAQRKALQNLPKGSSYRQWGQRLIQHAQSERLSRQLSYWKDLVSHHSVLPVDRKAEAATFSSMQQVASALNKTATQSLLQEVNQSYGTEINDLLLAALAQTIGAWTGDEKILVGLEGHGRENLFPELDISNTVGWFTSLYPVAFRVEKEVDTADFIKSIKEQLREVPDKGMGYGLLRYCHPLAEVRSALAATHWDIEFNYLGQIDNMAQNYQWLKEAVEPEGQAISAEYPIKEKLLVNASIAAGKLQVSWTYSSLLYQEETIAQLAEAYSQNLIGLIDHCLQQQGRNYTPSDLGLEGAVDYKDLDQLIDYLEEKELDGDEILKF